MPDGRARWTTLSLEENVELVADCDRFKLLTYSNGELEESPFVLKPLDLLGDFRH